MANLKWIRESIMPHVERDMEDNEIHLAVLFIKRGHCRGMKV